MHAPAICKSKFTHQYPSFPRTHISPTFQICSFSSGNASSSQFKISKQMFPCLSFSGREQKRCNWVTEFLFEKIFHWLLENCSFNCCRFQPRMYYQTYPQSPQKSEKQTGHPIHRKLRVHTCYSVRSSALFHFHNKVHDECDIASSLLIALPNSPYCSRTSVFRIPYYP